MAGCAKRFPATGTMKVVVNVYPVVNDRSGRLDRFGNWWRPWHYGDPIAEYWAVREGVSIGDVSTLGKLVVTGPDVVDFVERLYPCNVADIKPGRSRYALLLNERGHIMDDGMILREAETRFVLTFTSGGAANAAVVRGTLAEALRILREPPRPPEPTAQPDHPAHRADGTQPVARAHFEYAGIRDAAPVPEPDPPGVVGTGPAAVGVRAAVGQGVGHGRPAAGVDRDVVGPEDPAHGSGRDRVGRPAHLSRPPAAR